MNSRTFLVTGGCGFIGCHMVKHLLSKGHKVANIDCLTYAADVDNLEDVANDENYDFYKIDITDKFNVDNVFDLVKPDKVIHFAAESHVDNSISGPEKFIQTNIVGTFNMLEGARKYFNTLDDEHKKTFKFHHVSTDEVFGDLASEHGYFDEWTEYEPSSPYSASKAASDHLVRAWGRTYGLPWTISNCSNNFGPNQHNEKLIPTVIRKALSGEDIPVYGEGKQIRDWLYVEDHVKAIYDIVMNDVIVNETYCIGCRNEMKNIDIVTQICMILDEIAPKHDHLYIEQVKHVKDRPGHDYRYAIDNTKILSIGWRPSADFRTNLYNTVKWYVDKFRKEHPYS